MLEVVLPFLYLQSPEFQLAQVYAYFKQFVRNFIPNNLHVKFNGVNNVLPYMKCTLSLLNLLLKYIDREVYSHLQSKKVQIETYAAPWVATLFTRTVDFALLYELWEIFMFERDSYFILYFSVALIRANRDTILKHKTIDRLMAVMQRLVIKDLEQLANVYREAIEIRKNTPVSFQLLCEQLGVFVFNPIISNEELDTVENAQLQVFEVWPQEILQGAY